jgi:hypothetical protein
MIASSSTTAPTSSMSTVITCPTMTGRVTALTNAH